MDGRFQRLFAQKGYSLIELMLTTGIMGVVGAIAVFQIGASRPGLKSDGAMRTVMAQLNTARELSITQRRSIRVNFNNGSEVQLVRQDLPAGTTVLQTIPLEGGVTFSQIDDDKPDTPDTFGDVSEVYFAGAAWIQFMSDGTLVNQNGSPVNGTVFLAYKNEPRSARAVTVLGATGRVRAFKWDGRKWVRV